ncbi:hypothetical protein PLEOSDRAFT_1072032 [Pleurotus ostreatus PC15]|uniref:Uncharacterized protein n=1 Tax=Pleurotus ostreatus (strain PC15) TaxID=1137138 RepID=A0A067NCX1_PLEO1|nr:hypothetical protein PLEOSDRAFT_1072032 [Pleurotus ostreatus PC15]
MTGRLLCPIEFNWDDASVRALLRKHDDPSYDVNSSYFIRFLYQGQEGDPEDVEKGFLYSEWIVRGLRHVFTSPSSVFQSTTERENEPPAKKARKKPTKQTVAQLMGMKRVTPRSVAYIAVLIHFSLTDAENWCIDYNGFNYLGFYNAIVDYFETAAPDTDEYENMQDILAWYDRSFRCTPKIPLRPSLPQRSETSWPDNAQPRLLMLPVYDDGVLGEQHTVVRGKRSLQSNVAAIIYSSQMRTIRF